MISQREMVLFRKFKKVDNGYDVVVKSTNHKNCKITNDIVRAEVVVQNIKIRRNEKDEGKSDIVLLNQINRN